MIQGGQALSAGPFRTPEQWLNLAFASANRLLSMAGPWTAAVILLLMLQVWHVLNHVHWSDEWQALLIVAQSPDLSVLLQNLHYEGHPPLWYLLLRSASMLLPWAQVLTGIQLSIALALQTLILLRAPFPRAERWLLGMSYFILFEFGTLSRGLSLGALLVVAFFALRGAGTRWLIVILLPMVDFQFGLLSIIAIAILAWDRQMSAPGLLIWVVSGLMSAWAVLPAPDMMTSQDGGEIAAAAVKLVDDFSALLIPVQTLNGKLGWSGGWPWGLGFVGGPLFLAFSLAQTRVTPLYKWLFRFFLAATCLFSLTVYSLSIRHLTLVALLLILIKWREAEQGMPPGLAFRLWIAVAALGGMSVTAIAASRPFDSAPAVAGYIRAHGLEGRNWVAWRPERGMSVGVLLGREFAMAQTGCRHGFIRWNFRDTIRSETSLISSLRPFADRYGRSYLITTLPPEVAKDPFLKFMAAFPPGYDGYPYYIYIVGPERPETHRRPPLCPPHRRALSPEMMGFSSL